MTLPLQPGEVIAGKYQVERVIGEGGMGVVVVAMHQQLQQRVAIKLLRTEGTPDPAVVTRFFREARAAARLRSEHVARVLDVGTLDNSSPYMVMEFLEGEDLGALAKRGPLSVDEAVGHVLQACEGLAEAHAAGIVHRDLKPENLFLTRRRDGSPCIKVLDFGISKMAEEGAANLTATGSMLGTPLYMSPEQLRSSRQVDARTDIWSLGMILYKLLTGQVAFQRSTLPELCAAILLEELVPPQELRPDLPEGLAIAICRALDKDPAFRHASLAEFTAAIAPHARPGTGSAQRVASILDIQVGPPAALAPTSSREPAGTGDAAGHSAPPPSSSAAAAIDLSTPPARRLSPVLAVVAAALVAVPAGFLLWRSGSTRARGGEGASGAAPAACVSVVSPVVSSPLPAVAPVAPTVASAGVSALPAVPSSAPAVIAPAAPVRASPRPATSVPSNAPTGQRTDGFGTRQ